ncbi:unnamed protein product, partial [marine sediment metagenome]
MKRQVLVLIAVVYGTYPLLSQNVSITDINFLNALIEIGVDTNGDNIISYEG